MSEYTFVTKEDIESAAGHSRCAVLMGRLLAERGAALEVAAKRIFEDLQNSEYDVRNGKQADVLMVESGIIAREEARRLLSQQPTPSNGGRE